jgi:hypothetical protein
MNLLSLLWDNLNIKVVGLVLGLALSFGSAWQIQSWRYAAAESARLEQVISDNLIAAKKFDLQLTTTIEAQNHANERLVIIKKDADSAKSQLGSLRVASNIALQAAGQSIATTATAAATFSELFNICSARYQILGEEADGHVSDLRTRLEIDQKAP